MKTEVTEQGVNIPKHLLGGAKEIEIRQENNRIVIIPLSEEDPILRFGKNPVEDEVTDVSIDHDKYIYEK